VPISTITTQSSKKKKRIATSTYDPSSIYTIDTDQDNSNLLEFDHPTEDLSTSSNLLLPSEDTSY
ncbi:11026_t:CDS:1, partial [Scutellospora calospora]